MFFRKDAKEISRPFLVGFFSNFEAAETPPGEASFDPSGNYYPEVDPDWELRVQINLKIEKRQGRSSVSGGIALNGNYYKFDSVTVTEKSLKFKTAKIKGIEDRFEGDFLSRGNFSQRWSGKGGKSKLRGTLRKFVDGQKTAEITVPFLYYPGC